MNIIKRNRQVEEFTFDKIKKAIAAAFAGLNELVSKNEIQAICDVVSQHIQGKDCVEVETIQDLVETALMERGHYKVAKAYILYRDKRAACRAVINQFKETISDERVLLLLEDIQEHFTSKPYALDFLYAKYRSFYKVDGDTLQMLIKACS